jgi:chromosome segregation ATPase
MHDTAMEIGCLVMDRYSDLPKAKVLELGSYDVNGSLRGHAPKTTEYVGLDLEAGPGVDFVVEPGKPWPVEDDHFDLVLASSVFEHDPMFWLTFLQMVKKARTGGYIYISAPSNGSVHRYPEDHWRFYPDSGLALERWAVSQGEPVVLVESFTAGRKGDEWNDFVAVFRKGKGRQNLPRKFVHQQVRSFNILTWNKKELANPSTKTEDMLIIDEARAAIRELDEKVASLNWENNTNWDERQKAEQALLLTETRLSQEQAGHEASRKQLVELAGNLERQRTNVEAAEARAAEFQELAVSLRMARDELATQFEAHKQAAEQTLAEAATAKAAELEELANLHRQARAELAEELERQKGELERSTNELELSRSELEESKVATERALVEAAAATAAKAAEIEQLEAQHKAAQDALAEEIERQKAAAERALSEAAQAKAAEIEELAARHHEAQTALAEQIQHHQAAAAQALARLAESEASLDHLQAIKSALEEEVQRQQAALKESEDLKVRLAVAESTLAQRQEEIAQTRDELVGLRSAHDALRGERESLSIRLREADQWVFRLAADRKQLELEADRASRSIIKVETETRAEIARLSNKLASHEAEREGLVSRVTASESELDRLSALNADVAAELADATARLEALAGDRDTLLAQLDAAARKASGDAAEIADLKGELGEAHGRHQRLVADLNGRLRLIEEERDMLLGKLARVSREAEQRQDDIVLLTQMLSAAQTKDTPPSQELTARLRTTEEERDAAVKDFARANRLAAERSDEIATLTKLLDEAAAKGERAAKEAEARFTAAERERASVSADLAKTQREASERITEIVTLTRALEVSQLEIDTRQKNVDWLRDISRAIQSTPRWWSLLPKKEKRKRELRRLRNIGLFDSQAYLERYPDVLEAGMDPLDHYIIHGVNEGRSI